MTLNIDTGQDHIDAILADFADDPDPAATGERGVPYGGYDLDPTEDRPPCYQAVLQARESPPDHLANWELIGYITMLGAALGYDNAAMIEDMRAHPAPPYGFDPGREPNEVRRLAPQVREGDQHAPSAHRLAELGVLPDAGACDCPIHEDEHERTGDLHPRLPDAHLADRLAVLSPHEQRRAARKRGYDWPDTGVVRDRLAQRLKTAIRNGETVVVDAPTAAGKTYTVAAEPWLAHPETTGEAPVVHLHETGEARDQAAAESAAEDGVDHAVLRGRDELCPVAGGDHDPNPDGDDPDVVLTVDGTPASEWLAHQCDHKNVPFSVAHAYLAEYNDQGRPLPCCEGDAECPAHTQWNGLPRGEDGDPTVDVIHATHQFAYVPSLRANTNVVVDEQPDYRADIEQECIRRAITAFLRDADAPVGTFEQFVSLARLTDYTAPSDALNERDATRSALDHQPDRGWYIEHPDAHALAPALARAIWYALGDDDGPDKNGRYSATVAYEPPRFDADGDQWDREYVKVVINDDHDVRDVWAVPDFSAARSVIGLDAHPSRPLWALNVHPGITADAVLDGEERRLWRRYERGLTVVQLGDATRPLTTEESVAEYFDPDHCEATIRAINRLTNGGLTTGTTSKEAKPHVRQAFEDAGVDDPDLIHIGEEKSRNDFAGEDAGLAYNNIDPGDGTICDVLAALGQDAAPTRSDCRHCDGTGTCPNAADGDPCGREYDCHENDDNPCTRCEGRGDHRAKGRGFDGPDADAAAEVLASVREHRVAQCAGRYARNPDDPTDGAVTFIATDATPEGFVDVTAPGVPRLATDAQRDIYDALCDRATGDTARAIADAADVSKEHVRQTLQRFEDDGLVERRDRAGPHGADTYRATDPTADVDAARADLGGPAVAGETTNDPVWATNTWALAVCDRDAPDDAVAVGNGGEPAGTAPAGDRPPD